MRSRYEKNIKYISITKLNILLHQIGTPTNTNIVSEAKCKSCRKENDVNFSVTTNNFYSSKHLPIIASKLSNNLNNNLP